MFSYIWIFPLIIIYFFHAYFSKSVNETEGIKTIFLLFIIQGLGIPLWIFVSKYSKNLIFDGIIFDLIITFTYFLTLIYLGSGKQFIIQDWIGISFILLGIVLVKSHF